MLESLSLIDAVMPDVVEARKSVPKNQNKSDSATANGDGDASAVSKYLFSKTNFKTYMFDCMS